MRDDIEQQGSTGISFHFIPQTMLSSPLVALHKHAQFFQSSVLFQTGRQTSFDLSSGSQYIFTVIFAMG